MLELHVWGEGGGGEHALYTQCHLGTCWVEITATLTISLITFTIVDKH